MSLGDLLGPEFKATPKVMFSADQFHPSSAGYARVAAALLPSVLDALGEHTNVRPVLSRLGSGVEPSVSPVSVAAKRAVAHPGTEVSAAEVDGAGHGSRGRWATLLRRSPGPGPEPADTSEETAADGPTTEADGTAPLPAGTQP